MSLELLISAVGQDPKELIGQMNIQGDAILIDQKMPYGYETIDTGKARVKTFLMQEKGVGLSRNTALDRASADLALFSDEDIVYVDGYEKLIEDEFAKHKDADMILFNVEVEESRRTYWTESEKSIHRYNCGRYPAYSFAIRTEKMHENNLKYHQWFGGGARYSNGEDSLFINDALKAGLKVIAVPVCIGREMPRQSGEGSTWFKGYNEKFFYDRGVLYHYLYGRLAFVMAMRFLLKNKAVMCNEISLKEAFRLMKKGYSI